MSTPEMQWRAQPVPINESLIPKTSLQKAGLTRAFSSKSLAAEIFSKGPHNSRSAGRLPVKIRARESLSKANATPVGHQAPCPVLLNESGTPVGAVASRQAFRLWGAISSGAQVHLIGVRDNDLRHRARESPACQRDSRLIVRQSVIRNARFEPESRSRQIQYNLLR